MSTEYFGKFRGIVLDNSDPLSLGRVRIAVPVTEGFVTEEWATPCLPVGGGPYRLPDVGSGVWVEFERGDPSLPIWSGSWPALPEEATAVLTAATPTEDWTATLGGHRISLSADAESGGITVEAATGAKVSLTAEGIVVDNGAGAQITLFGRVVSINGGALEVI